MESRKDRKNPEESGLLQKVKRDEERKVMKITKISQYSGKVHTLDLNVTEEQLNEFRTSNKNIQDIFPNLNADEREFLMTGITKEEWDVIFPKKTCATEGCKNTFPAEDEIHVPEFCIDCIEREEN